MKWFQNSLFGMSAMHAGRWIHTITMKYKLDNKKHKIIVYRTPQLTINTLLKTLLLILLQLIDLFMRPATVYILVLRVLMN